MRHYPPIPIVLRMSKGKYSCTHQVEGARGTQSVLLACLHLHDNSLQRVVYCACAETKRVTMS